MIDARRELWYAAAEERLGRELTAAERHVDIERLDAALKQGKQDLAAAIEREKQRSFQASLAGKANWRPQLTPDMEKVLVDLHELGRRIGLEELRSMGYEIRDFADSPDTEAVREARRKVLEAIRRGDPKRKIGALRKAFEALLTTLGLRIRRTTRKLKPVLTVKLDTLARRKIEREAEKRVPGSLDIAGRLVSGALYSGLGATFEEHEGLIPCWEYSAIMDNATCAPCRQGDGQRFDTWAAAMKVLPGGGPNPRCLGDGRCRCRLVPCLPDALVDKAPESIEMKANDLFTLPPVDMLALVSERMGTPVTWPNMEMAQRMVAMQDELNRQLTIRLPKKVGAIPFVEIAPRDDPLGVTHGFLGRSADGEPLIIGVSDERLEGSFPHEFAHFIDAILALGDGTYRKEYGSARAELERTDGGTTLFPQPNKEAYDELFEEIERTESVLRIRSMLESVNFGDTFWNRVGEDGKLLEPDGDYLRYLLQPHELFARAFAAFIAENGTYENNAADKRFQDLYSSREAYYPQGFTAYDRRILTRAFRRFFEKVGWAP